jgi:hypothetical protein
MEVKMSGLTVTGSAGHPKDAVIQLSKPIEAFGETHSVLELRKPTAKDIRACGLPFSLDGKNNIIIKTEECALLIARLTGIPGSAVDQLSAPDFNAALVAVIGFFGESIPAT